MTSEEPIYPREYEYHHYVNNKDGVKKRCEFMNILKYGLSEGMYKDYKYKISSASVHGHVPSLILLHRYGYEDYDMHKIIVTSASYGHLNVIKHFATNNYHTIYHMACIGDYIHIVRYVVNIKTSLVKYFKPLADACNYNSLRVIKFIVQNLPLDSRTLIDAFLFSCKSGYIDVIKLFLDIHPTLAQIDNSVALTAVPTILESMIST
jgi:hypothetical protein